MPTNVNGMFHIYIDIYFLRFKVGLFQRDPGRSVEWGLGSQFCQPILLHTKCTGFNNGIILYVGKILFILYENSD